MNEEEYAEEAWFPARSPKKVEWSALVAEYPERYPKKLELLALVA
jgi:hypothetical protein